MLKERIEVFKRVNLLLDLSLVALSFFLGYAFLSSLLKMTAHSLYPFNSYIIFLPLLLIFWGGFLCFFGMYNSLRIESFYKVLLTVLKAAFFSFIIFSSLSYILKTVYVNRLLIVCIFVFSVIFISIEKIVLVWAFRYMHRLGYNTKNILIIGANKKAGRFVKMLKERPEWAFNVVGVIDKNPSKAGKLIEGVKVIGTFKDINRVVHNNVIDEIIVIIPYYQLGRIRKIMSLCETEGIRTSIAVDYFEFQLSQAKESNLKGIPLLTFEATRASMWHLAIKRFFDLIVSGLALVLFSPVFIVTALAIKLDSRGPAIFKQFRGGLNGRKITMYKFRTMVADADARIKELLDRNEMQGPVFKIEDDPRLTKLGKYLRKFSIDELPQLWNVFKGDMSLVGPRPHLIRAVKKYNAWQRRRLSMKPGITCIWQVSGRNTIKNFSEWTKLDLKYIDNWSFWLDIKILLKTIPAVIFTRGAR